MGLRDEYANNNGHLPGIAVVNEFDKLTGKIVGLESGMAALTERLDRVSTSVDNIARAVNTNAQVMGQITDVVNEHGEALDSVEQRLDEVEADLYEDGDSDGEQCDEEACEVSDSMVNILLSKAGFQIKHSEPQDPLVFGHNAEHWHAEYLKASSQRDVAEAALRDANRVAEDERQVSAKRRAEQRAAEDDAKRARSKVAAIIATVKSCCTTHQCGLDGVEDAYMVPVKIADSWGSE
jgi:chromosome segregation ATPase